jgi:hypothetical protein
VARQPLPPQVICKILGMDEAAVKAGVFVSVFIPVFLIARAES